MSLRFRVLGPLTIELDDKPLPPLRPRERAVLGRLLISPNRYLTTSQLIADMWEGEAPQTARSQVQSDLAIVRRKLRALGAADPVVTRSGGYLLTVDDADLDLADFRRLAASGALREALALWRGEALADVSAPYAESFRAQLTDERLAVHEKLADAELALGNHGAVAAELTELVAAYPFRDGLRERLMLALGRGGRRIDALEVYREGVSLHLDELGIEPDERLTKLHQSILDNDLGTPGAALPVNGFVGRQVERTGLRELLANGQTGYLSGLAGTGKTTLAQIVAADMAEAFPDGRIYLDCHRLGDGVQADVLRALKVPVQGDVLALYQRILADRKVLLILDNVEDPFGLVPAGTPAIIISRTLIGPEDAPRIVLEPLSTTDSLDLVRVNVGAHVVDAEPEAAARLVALCGGLPLALRIASRRIAQQPQYAMRDFVDRLSLTAGRLSTTGVESALQASLARLAPATRRLLLTLSKLPTAEFPGWIAGPMADRPHEAGRMLDELVQAAMLTQVHDVSGPRFLMHDLVRRFAEERCAAEVPDADNILRRALDLLADVAIEAQETLPNNPFPSPITAGNAAPAAVLADPASWFEVERALLLRALDRRPDWRLLAGTVIMVSTSGLDDEWRAAARRLLDDPTVDDLPRAMIQMALAGMLLPRGHDEDPAPLARAARRTFVALGDPLRAAVSALLLAAARRRSHPRVAEAALAWSLARVDGHYAAHALVVRGNMRADEERFDEAVVDYRAALSLLEDDPFPPAEANALVCLANVLRHGDMLDPASHGLIERAMAIFRQLGDLVAVCHCQLALARQHLHLGRPEDAERVARQALLLSSDIGHLNAAESTRALIKRMTDA